MDNKSPFFQELSKSKHVTLIGPLLKALPQIENETLLIALAGRRDWLLKSSHAFLSIGDADSAINKEFDIKLKKTKDRSDLFHALVLLKNPLYLKLYGFYGARFDHQLANLGELLHFLQSNKTEITYYDQDNLPLMQLRAKGNWKFEYRGLFSIMTPLHCQMKIDGEVKYPYNKKENWGLFSSQGLSNEDKGQFKITSSQ